MHSYVEESCSDIMRAISNRICISTYIITFGIQTFLCGTVMIHCSDLKYKNEFEKTVK
jgi:hypothetical protein